MVRASHAGGLAQSGSFAGNQIGKETMERISRLTAAAVLLGIAGWVNATPMTFTDIVDPEPNVFVSANDTSLAFQHDVTDDAGH